MCIRDRDGFNLAWKLGSVVSGRAPESLLDTYSAERQVVAKNLIDFDREWSTLMATPQDQLPDPSYLEDFYVRTAEFPAGFMTEYKPSQITGGTEHQELAAGFPVGKRFKSARVKRVCDATDQHLGHRFVADGRWRIHVFADTPTPGEDSGVERLGRWLLEDPQSPIVAYRREGEDENRLFDIDVTYQQRYTEFEITDAPRAFRPVVGRYGLDYWENVYATLSQDEDIFEQRGISRDGAIVVVRPDMYVSAVLPLDATDELSELLSRSFLKD